jgi:hypothetical protein
MTDDAVDVEGGRLRRKRREILTTLRRALAVLEGEELRPTL